MIKLCFATLYPSSKIAVGYGSSWLGTIQRSISFLWPPLILCKKGHYVQFQQTTTGEKKKQGTES